MDSFDKPYFKETFNAKSEKENLQNEPTIVFPKMPDHNQNAASYNNINFNLFDQSSLNYTQNSLPEYNILLLGGTGNGKSTTINAFANYVKYANFEEALNKKFIELISSSFMIYDSKTNKNFLINSGNNVDEYFEGQSVTQKSMAYKFYFNNKLIRLIDTPGFGDTRGLNVDKDNVDNILKYLKNYKHLHGIVIIIKANETRNLASFRYCMHEFIKKLHKSASKNIIICFTFGRNTYYRPGDGFILIKEFFEQNFPEMQLVFKVGTNCFFIDNEAYRYIVAKNCGYIFDQNDKSSYTESWNKSAANTKKMIFNILEQIPHELNLTFELNNVQNFILEIAEIMLVLQKNIFLKLNDIDFQKKKIKNAAESLDNICNLKKNLKIVLNDIKISKLEFPKTVCTSENCIEIVNVNNVKTIIYKSKCCTECKIKDIKPVTKEQKRLQKCTAFSQLKNKKTGPCLNCGCNWKKHIHIKIESEIVQRTVNFSSREIFSKQVSSEENYECLNNVLLKIEKLYTEYKTEIDVIQESAAMFDYYLKTNSNSSFNQVIEPYLELLISEEKLKINKLKNYSTKTFEMLISLQSRHNEHVERIAKSIKNQNDLDFCNITEIAKKLYSLKHNGNQFLNFVQKFATNINCQFHFEEKDGVTVFEDF